MPLGFDEPPSVAAVTFCYALTIFAGEEVRISARKRNNIKRLKKALSPLPMPLFIKWFGPIGKRSENLDQHMIAAKTEGRRLRRYTRGRTPELVGDNRAAW